MSTRTRLSILIFIMVQAVLFSIGLVATLLLTDDSYQRAWGILVTIVLALVIGVPLTWFLAPRLRAQYVREHVRPMQEEL